MEEIVLGDNQIEALINGESIHVSLSSGKTVSIRQSYMIDATAPMINRDKKIFSNDEIKNIKMASSMMADTFKMGV